MRASILTLILVCSAGATSRSTAQAVREAVAGEAAGAQPNATSAEPAAADPADHAGEASRGTPDDDDTNAEIDPDSPHASAPAAPDLDRTAHRLFVAGRDAYQEGRFEEAAALWERAFDLSGRATLLLGLGDAYDRLRQGRRAASVLRQYLVLEPDTDSREHLESRIEWLMRDSGDASPRRRTATYILAGSAGAAGLVSGLYWARARSRYDTLTSTCGGTPAGCANAQIDSVRSAQRVSRAALGLAVGAAIAAVVTYFLEGGHERAGRAERAERRRARNAL